VISALVVQPIDANRPHDYERLCDVASRAPAEPFRLEHAAESIGHNEQQRIHIRTHVAPVRLAAAAC
jgi:hypothetical protein